MAAIRHVLIENFRGFERFSTPLRSMALVTGEPGAGRSDLIEALIRTLDPDYLRSRRADDLDFHQLDTSREVKVEVVIGQLSDAARIAYSQHIELWDAPNEVLIAELAAGEARDPKLHKEVVRFGYRLVLGEDGLPDESLYWPKHARPAEGHYPSITRSERGYVPFYWQRGLSLRPLDLSTRGEMRELIDSQDGETFDVAIRRFMDGVVSSAAEFSDQERVAAALTQLLAPLRSVRRFDNDELASSLVQFLPEGGAPSGLLRSLSAAVTLEDGPSYLPAWRHGTTLLAAMRGGMLYASATSKPGAIVAIDDLGGDLDPMLAGHLVVELRKVAGQVIAASRLSQVVDTFRPQEVVRLYRREGVRQVALGKRPKTKSERAAARWYAPALVPALSASVVVVVEGFHDRMALTAVVRRAVELGTVPSYAGAGISIIDAEGTGGVPKLAEMAKSLGLYVIALLDNDGTVPVTDDEVLNAARAAADVTVRLPPRTAIERLLLRGVPDAELVRAWQALDEAMGGLAMPLAWETKVEKDLVTTLAKFLHGKGGSLHAGFVEMVEPAMLCPEAVVVLVRLHEIATSRPITDLVEL